MIAKTVTAPPKIASGSNFARSSLIVDDFSRPNLLTLEDWMWWECQTILLRESDDAHNHIEILNRTL
jgi:hypothetical protein